MSHEELAGKKVKEKDVRDLLSTGIRNGGYQF